MKKRIGKVSSSQLKKQLLDYGCFLLGAAFYAFAFCYFIKPNNISPGGITGIAAIFNTLFGTPTGLVLFLLNIPILWLGFHKIGGGFLIKTLVATLLTSVLIDVFTLILPTFRGERLLAALFGGVLAGVGFALVLLRGGTTGGVDIIAKVIRLKYPFFSMGRLILLLDGAVILLATLCYRDIETALYTVLSLFISSKVMDTVLYGADQGRLLFIITTKGKAMTTALFRSVGRGTTVVPSYGGFREEEKQMLLCAVRPQEVSRAMETVKNIDEQAFTVVTVAGGIFGYGFEKEKG